MSDDKFDIVKHTREFFGVSEAEREVVLKAAAMLTLADDIDTRAARQGPYPAIRLTRSEWDLVCYALRHTADSDN